ncbi:PstS family phosphate ABC transporter substrate-binding protein [Sporohalobacter salinus]|uniref:PstS family phosphate ABC transporter substrate-binding protein n=1 Tax=Sporohalobacter salinus TaxID=1494606 RepID=UPI00195F6160|nr:PstS family phosphate ABC transporter substrate-binding protein [Sporohalobacter salinus]MBM7624957.1 phosphate transport system substrate-binding protein [Sporohalobacter salinus]
MKKSINKELIILVSILTLVGVVLAGCGGGTNQSQKEYLQIKGSDTMVNMAQVLSEKYMGKKKEAAISVTGGGSGTGIAALINDKVDIANASRIMKDKEIKQAKDNGVNPKRFVIAMDGLAVVINGENLVEELTINEIARVFRGEITNWKELGGPDKKISLYGRQSNSGTFVYFRDNVLKSDYSANMKRMNGNAQIVESVKEDKAGIGYVGIGYVVKDGKVVNGLNVLNVAKDAESKAASPLKPENVKTGAYPLARPLNQYTNGQPTGLVLDFIKYELSEKGQKIAVEEGFYPVSPKFQKLNQKNLSK